MPGPLVDELATACERLNLHVVVGMNERDRGTLYNAYLPIGPGGLLHRHRKLMPTQQERLFHGIGAGDDLQPVDTPIGRVGGLICWENRMPLARWAVYQGSPQIWVAPTADDSDGWLASMRHIAIESGAFVISVPQYIPGSAFPADFPVEIDRDHVYGRGGAVIVEPTGATSSPGPLRRRGDHDADCDLRVGLHAKRWFDAVGHYSRTDVLSPQLTVVAAPAPADDRRVCPAFRAPRPLRARPGAPPALARRLRPAPRRGRAAGRRGLDRAVDSLVHPRSTRLKGPAPRDEDGRPLAPQDAWGHDHCWWLDRMVRTQAPLVERMTLVWHDWFATSKAAAADADAAPERAAAPPRARLVRDARDRRHARPGDAAVAQRHLEPQGTSTRTTRASCRSCSASAPAAATASATCARWRAR